MRSSTNLKAQPGFTCPAEVDGEKRINLSVIDADVASLSVLVVIPTLNEAANIGRVIAALSAGFRFDGKSKIVVVDGGSVDDTRDVVSSLMNTNASLLLQHNPKRIQSAAINLAVREFGRDMDVLIRCDAHAHYPPDFISRLLIKLQQTGSDAVVVPMDSVGEQCLSRGIAWLSDSVVGSGGAAHRGSDKQGYVDHGHHAAFRLDTFRIIGGYDESFHCNEDAELDCRQRAIGATIYLDGGNRIRYQPRSNLSALWHQYFGYGVGRSRTMRRHPRSIRLRQLAVPSHFALSMLCLLFAYWIPALLIWPIAYLFILGLNSCLLILRHQSWCALGAVPAAITMHLAWSLGFFRELLRVREQRWIPAMIEPLTS
jgi:succinoglycan biosynthesis protein ExoA